MIDSHLPAAVWAFLLLYVLIFARVVVGGGLILIGASISASPSRSLAGPATPVGTFLRVRWPNKGWSRPLLPDHGELAASEQAQLEAVRARRGWRPISLALTSQFNESTHRRRLRPRGAASGAASAQLSPRGVASAAPEGAPARRQRPGGRAGGRQRR